MQELVKDMVEIVTSFTTRVYGERGHKYEKLMKCVEESTRILERTILLVLPKLMSRKLIALSCIYKTYGKILKRNICIPGM